MQNLKSQISNLKSQISIIIAVYNRSDELTELLESLEKQTDKNFELIIVDDGSTENLKIVTEKYQNKLNVNYFYKENSGPGLTRNFGTQKATGNYFLFLDSDCIAPSNYISNIKKELSENYSDAFGGSDAAHESFNPMQKAISYSMTSVLTTGGIRGKEKAITKFQPRSFNMGISKVAFSTVGGFSEMRIGEDPDLSLTLWENGFSTRFFPSVQVFHKRRTSLRKFAKQVYQFGIARPILNQRHPKYAKIVFWFPSLFLVGSVFSFLFLVFSFWLKLDANMMIYEYESCLMVDAVSHYKNYYSYASFLIIPFYLLTFYFLLIFFHSTIKNKNLKIGFLSIITSAIQLYCYGWGFLKSFVKLNIFRMNPKKAFPSHFY